MLNINMNMFFWWNSLKTIKKLEETVRTGSGFIKREHVIYS